MGLLEANDPKVLRSYEGLIFTTTQRVHGRTEEDFEDVRQILRVKVWRALCAYEPSGTLPRKAEVERRNRFVFSCMTNQVKDLLKKKRRGEIFIDDYFNGEGPAAEGNNKSREWFDGRYLAESHEQVFHGVEDSVLIPNTLDDTERQVVCLLYYDYGQTEIARTLGLEKRAMERTMKSIRAKMSDWRPDSLDRLELPAPELAQAA